MFRAFNVEYNWTDAVSSDIGENLFQTKQQEIKGSIEGFLNNGVVQGTNLIKTWFPQIKTDVFISHSHADRDQAIKCAGWLKSSFQLDSFIDSCVWGQADTLLNIIDKKYCSIPGTNRYDYAKRNHSTSHVHMMLANALSEMIDTAECVLFLNSPNSITSEQAIAQTRSPWLFLELGIMRIIRRKIPSRPPLAENFSNKSAEARNLNIEYEVPLKELTALNGSQLSLWYKLCQESGIKSQQALDVLYGLMPCVDSLPS